MPPTDQTQLFSIAISAGEIEKLLRRAKPGMVGQMRPGQQVPTLGKSMMLVELSCTPQQLYQLGRDMNEPESYR